MATILNFSQRKEAADDSHRRRLLAYCKGSSFPGEQYLDEEFQQATFTRESHDLLQRLFKDFGVDLDPSAVDFSTVTNTWFVLTGCVGEHLLAKELFETSVYAVDSAHWSTTYKAYVEALWEGDRAGICQAARSLGIATGIPKGFAAFYRPVP